MIFCIFTHISILKAEVGFLQIALIKLCQYTSVCHCEFPNQTIYHPEIFVEFSLSSLGCNDELN